MRMNRGGGNGGQTIGQGGFPGTGFGGGGGAALNAVGTSPGATGGLAQIRFHFTTYAI